MASGIKIKDIKLGEGPEAIKGVHVTLRCHYSLNQGEQLPRLYDYPISFQIGKRDVIAGLEKGVIGMRVGGKRKLRISPHLAYGEEGLPGHIPPLAVLICDIELLSVNGTNICQ
jgi:FKBP-type peptidyl-prolyl cis-trans isomerase